MPDEIWLPKDVNEHTAENLKPGERYQIEIKSMTEFHKCRDEKAPKAVVLTRPLPQKDFEAAVYICYSTIGDICPGLAFFHQII